MQVHLISVLLTLAIVLPTVYTEDVYCGEPPVVPFATTEESSIKRYLVGSTVTYTCKFGYIKRGKGQTSECEFSDSLDSAEWTQPEFSCIPQSCGDPGYVNNGRRIGSLFAFPSSVKYECNEGYKLKGLSTRYCQASGTWSGKLPTCEDIKCSLPRNPENGLVTYITLDYGSELDYKCNKGFRLNTDEAVYCTSGGKWSNTNVQCIESVCDMPKKPECGSVQITGSSNKLLAGTLALFSCDNNTIADGPTTSKCLESGEWTFPPPKCLEPCKIPYVNDGVIGEYVREKYSRRRLFTQVPIGTKVEEDDALFLRCSTGYEIPGTEKNEQSVSCKLGKWSAELQCDPAFCRNEPPTAENAKAVVLNPEHGGKVLYLCDDDFKKTENETIVCDYGSWKGSPPICKNTNCFVNDLKFPGLLTGKKSIYKNGETFDVDCDSRYSVAHPNKKELWCEDGKWKGLLPPCVAASCTEPPPEIKHGKSEVHSTVHSSIVKYTCQDPYILSNSRVQSQVQCLFGEWVGQPPKCKDSRCYLNNLRNSGYVDFTATDSVTLPGNKLHVTCKEGYSPKWQQPVCLNGKWSEFPGSPCKENDCVIPLLYFGDIKEHRIGDYYWNWRSFKYIRHEYYEKIPAGTVRSYGTSLTLVCNKPYSFQGTSKNNQKITCSKGLWYPDPVCLLRGQPYVPRTTTQKPYITTSSFVTDRSKSMTTNVANISEVTPSEVTLGETSKTFAFENMPTTTVKPRDLECYCEYPINDENLIAHADRKMLKFQDKVKNDSVVVFRCKHVGYHTLEGTQSIKCENCRKWHSTDFPTCSEPTKGSAIIIPDNKLNVSIEGDLEAQKGQLIKLMCVAVEIAKFPHWDVPSEKRVTVQRERMERKSYGDVLYISHLSIKNADIENEGLYGCAVENNSMNFVNLIVNDPNIRCPEFPDVDGLQVIYEMERQVKSKAIFSCIKPHQEIVEKNTLTCKRSGEWSDPIPQCTDIKCKELKGNDLLVISYTNDRKIGSHAAFHCFSPAQRSGASFADCLENGTWSNPTPTCTSPPCLIDDIFSALPENVLPDVDSGNKTFSYNTTIKLTCAEDMIVEGEAIGKCNRKGEWDIGNVQCVTGCSKLATDPDSTLIFTPHKEVYKIFEMVTLSCPPGMRLNSQSQLVMCLKHGWSENALPVCQ